jgi:RNA polymerase-binding transcription factor DksA
MTASQLTTLRQELMKHLARIVRSAPRPAADDALAGSSPRDPDDEAEDALLDELDSISGELDDREAHLADEIVAALERMRTGEYGICVDCGQEIEVERLRAIPWTLRCAVDQSRFDEGARAPTL